MPSAYEQIMPIKVFYSYARHSSRDKPLKRELEKHLSNLRQQGQIIGWSYDNISPGTEWEQEIVTKLDKAQIILLLISPDYLYDDYCHNVEMRLALAKRKEGKAYIIPILLRPTDMEGAEFSEYQDYLLPSNKRAITQWPNRDEAYNDIAKGIRKVVQEFHILQRIIKTGEIEPLSPLTKSQPRLPLINQAKTRTTPKRRKPNEQILANEMAPPEVYPNKLLPKRPKIRLYENAPSTRGFSQQNGLKLIEQSFSSKEFDRCSKKNSGFALALYFLADVIALSMLIGNWLGSLQLTWLFIPLALLIFIWGLFNVNNPIAIILSLAFSGVWGLIALHYETWQPIAILALVAVLTCLHFFLFRKHVKQGLFTLS